jgi:hypothetical protein
MIRKVIIVLLALASVGSGVVWAISYQEPWIVDIFATDHSALGMGLGWGRAEFMYMSPIPREPYGLLDLASSPAPRPLFFWTREKRFGTDWSRVGFPLWFPVIVFAAYPVVALLRGPVRRWRRRTRCVCIECGYDLTGNVSGICPECGRPV